MECITSSGINLTVCGGEQCVLTRNVVMNDGNTCMWQLGSRSVYMNVWIFLHIMRITSYCDPRDSFLVKMYIERATEKILKLHRIFSCTVSKNLSTFY